MCVCLATAGNAKHMALSYIRARYSMAKISIEDHQNQVSIIMCSVYLFCAPFRLVDLLFGHVSHVPKNANAYWTTER